ncbi:MAG: hypothetical protein MJZ60_07505 [Bacteroidaceae bacterium]|nr:hypothetical protein [Bacteroidaceae bacterium]
MKAERKQKLLHRQSRKDRMPSHDLHNAVQQEIAKEVSRHAKAKPTAGPQVSN